MYGYETLLHNILFYIIYFVLLVKMNVIIADSSQKCDVIYVDP
jgi:hypothetical protein